MEWTSFTKRRKTRGEKPSDLFALENRNSSLSPVAQERCSSAFQIDLGRPSTERFAKFEGGRVNQVIPLREKENRISDGESDISSQTDGNSFTKCEASIHGRNGKIRYNARS